jgi:hypothetical protein
MSDVGVQVNAAGIAVAASRRQANSWVTAVARIELVFGGRAQSWRRRLNEADRRDIVARTCSTTRRRGVRPQRTTGEASNGWRHGQGVGGAHGTDRPASTGLL